METYSLEEYLLTKGEITYQVQGNSMLPLLRQDKDLVTVKAVSDKVRPQKLDVVLYKRNGDLVLHRIIGEDNNGYIILGDNTYIKERGINSDHIIGIMTEAIRSGKVVSVRSLLYNVYIRIQAVSYPIRFLFFLFRRMLAKAVRQVLNKYKK